jgi:hypothetical protein
MTAVVIIGVGTISLVSLLAVTIFSFGSAIGYRRGLSDGRRTARRSASPHTVVLYDALSASGRN